MDQKQSAFKELRSVKRQRVLLGAIGCHQEGRITFDCTIHNLSAQGCRIRFAAGTVFPSRIELINIRDQLGYEANVAWQLATEAGLTWESSIQLGSPPEPRLAHLRKYWLERALR
jgi:hypothetical protein